MFDNEDHVEDGAGIDGSVEFDGRQLSAEEEALISDLAAAAGTTRRDFLKALAVTGVTLPVAQLLTGCRSNGKDAIEGGAGGAAAGTVPVSLNVNGAPHRLHLDPRVT